MDYYDKINVRVSIAGGAGLNIPHGLAPTAPLDGDLWSTANGFYGRVNGVTVGPFNGPSASTYGRATTIARADAAVLIPTDFATLQKAIDFFGPSPQEHIEIRLVANHRPTTGLVLTEGDYSRYIITAEVQATAFIGVTAAVALTVGETLTQVTSGATGVVVSVGGWNSNIVLLSNVTGTFDTINEFTGKGAASVPRYVKQNVVLCPTFTGAVVDGVDAQLPQLACLIAGTGKSTSINFGYRAIGQSTGSVAVDLLT
jgi:hypothetical protein